MGKLNRVVTTLELARWAGCLVLMLAANPGAAIAADKVVLQLHRGALFEFAGYYAALWKGFYREAGIEVEIKPGAASGAASIDAVREVIERRAQFGTGTAQLLVRAAQGSPLVLLAPIFQRSGGAIYYRSDADFLSIRALLNAKLGCLASSNVLDLEFRAASFSEGIDPEKLKTVPIEPDQAVAVLADRRVEAVVGSAWELPWQAQQRSLALKSFELSSRPEFYGDGLFTLQRFANAEPGTAARFREASIRGWQYALQHPDEIAARIAELPALAPVSNPAGFVRYQSEVARRLARFPDIALGHADPERWSAIQLSLITIGAMSHPIDLKGFLYDSGADDWSSTHRLALLIVVAAAGFGLFAGAGAIWRRPRQSIMTVASLFAPNHLFALVRPWLARLRAFADGGLDRGIRVVRQLAGSPAGGPPVAPAIDLNAALAAVEGSIRQPLPGHIKMRLSLQPEAPGCYADGDSVTSLVRLLVAEAAADMPKGGELAIGTRKFAIGRAKTAGFPGSVPGDYLRLTVKDNGLGLSAEGLENVFYPVRTVRPAAAAAWELARRFGGFAAVESAEGVGTAVHLYFRSVEIAKRTEPAVPVHLLDAAE
jgi:ABC-type nitrate/sulfonate/bicarbonate transport system substrate-binding protein